MTLCGDDDFLYTFIAGPYIRVLVWCVLCVQRASLKDISTSWVGFVVLMGVRWCEGGLMRKKYVVLLGGLAWIGRLGNWEGGFLVMRGDGHGGHYYSYCFFMRKTGEAWCVAENLLFKGVLRMEGWF